MRRGLERSPVCGIVTRPSGGAHYRASERRRKNLNLRGSDLAKLVALVFALIVALRFLSAVGTALLFAVVVAILTMVLAPLVNWLERRRVPRAVAAVLVVGALLGIVVGLGLWLIPPLLEQTTRLVANVPDYLETIRTWINDLTSHYPRVQRILSPDEQSITDLVGRAEAVLLKAGRLFMDVLGWLGTVGLVLTMTAFTLARPRPLLRGLFALMPDSSRRPVAKAMHTTAHRLRVWIWASMLLGIIDGTLAYVGLSLLGVEPKLMLASLVFLGEFFPYVGPIAAGVPAVALGFAVSPLTPIWTLLLYLGIQALEGGVLHPLIVSREMDFHPLSIAFALIALGGLLGVLGAFLAIPALAVTKALYSELVLKPRQIAERELEECTDLVLDISSGDGEDTGARRTPE